MATTSRDIQPKKTSKKTPQKRDFQWTDDEAELLLSICYDYKSAKALDGVDWESVKSKYESFFELNYLISHCQLLKKSILTLV